MRKVLIWFRSQRFHSALTQHPLVKAPFNLWGRIRPDTRFQASRTQVMEEAERVINLPAGANLLIIYNLQVESPNFGELTDCLLLARYLASRKMRIRFLLVIPQTMDTESPNLTTTRLTELRRLAGALCGGDIELSCVGQLPDPRKEGSDWVHVLFSEQVHRFQPIFPLAPMLFSIPGFVRKFGDPKRLIEWNPSGYVGWHVRFSKENTARNYYSNQRLADDAEALARRFPNLPIRIFTDEIGRIRFTAIVEKDQTLQVLVNTGRLMLQKSTNFAEATAEAAGCNFWFQRLGGGIGEIPIFSPMPFLILSEDFYAKRLFKARAKKMYQWNHSGQLLLWSVFASITDASKLMAKVDANPKFGPFGKRH